MDQAFERFVQVEWPQEFASYGFDPDKNPRCVFLLYIVCIYMCVYVYMHGWTGMCVFDPQLQNMMNPTPALIPDPNLKPHTTQQSARRPVLRTPRDPRLHAGAFPLPGNAAGHGHPPVDAQGDAGTRVSMCVCIHICTQMCMFVYLLIPQRLSSNPTTHTLQLVLEHLWLNRGDNMGLRFYATALFLRLGMEQVRLYVYVGGCLRAIRGVGVGRSVDRPPALSSSRPMDPPPKHSTPHRTYTHTHTPSLDTRISFLTTIYTHHPLPFPRNDRSATTTSSGGARRGRTRTTTGATRPCPT